MVSKSLNIPGWGAYGASGRSHGNRFHFTLRERSPRGQEAGLSPTGDMFLSESEDEREERGSDPDSESSTCSLEEEEEEEEDEEDEDFTPAGLRGSEQWVQCRAGIRPTYRRPLRTWCVRVPQGHAHFRRLSQVLKVCVGRFTAENQLIR